MSFAPRHDYELFERVASPPRLRLAKSATSEAKFDRYSELLALTKEADKPRMTVVESRRRWLRDKLSLRLKWLAVFESLDQKLG